MRFARGILQLAFAVVFGFSSLLHGPAMTLRAAAAQPCHDIATDHRVAMAGHAAKHESQSQPAENNSVDQNVCPMPSCFLMVAANLPAKPFPAKPAGRIEPAVMPDPGALAPDPADPPPRLLA